MFGLIVGALVGGIALNAMQKKGVGQKLRIVLAVLLAVNVGIILQ